MVRIVDSEGSTVGAGFLVSSSGRIVTCAHVVQLAGSGPGKHVSLSWLQDGSQADARVDPDHWYPPDVEAGDGTLHSRESKTGRQGRDVAVLDLRDGFVLPTDVEPAILGSSRRPILRLQSYGFPAANPVGGLGAGADVIAKITRDGLDLLQIRSQEIARGFSGAPAWDDSGLVVGMVDSLVPSGFDPDLKERDTAFLTPIEVVRQCSGITLADGNPYRGLDPFSAEHKEFYFGRDGAIKELVTKLQSNDFVSLVGMSGSGKSSLVRAGLAKGFDRWTIPGLSNLRRCVFTPGVEPLLSFVAALRTLPNADLNAIDSILQPATGSDKTTEQIIGDWYSRPGSEIADVLLDRYADPGLLLIVDQFERLFTDCKNPKAPSWFVDALVAAAGDRIKILIAFRADFYASVLAFPKLATAIRKAQMTLLPMTDDELRKAVELPAQNLGRYLEPGLVEALVRDVGGRAGDLPLLEFSLTELWEKEAGSGLLSLGGYKTLGYDTPELKIPGAQGAIVKRAEEEWNKIPATKRSAAQRLFVLLVAVAGPGERDGSGVADASRRVRISELSMEEQEIAEKLAASFLLTKGRDPFTGEGMVEVAHESIIRHWPRLQGWMKQYRPFLAWYQRSVAPYLNNYKRESERRGKQRPALPDSVLTEALTWQQQYPGFFSGPLGDFVRASNSRRKSARRLKVAAAVLMSAVFIGILFLRHMYSESRADNLHDLGLTALGDRDYAQAELLLADALTLQNTDDVREDLLEARVSGPTALRERSPKGDIVAVSADGEVLGYRDNDSLRIWHRQGHNSEAVPFPLSSSGKDLDVRFALSSQGTLLAYGGSDGLIRLWDVKLGKEMTGWDLKTSDSIKPTLSPDYRQAPRDSAIDDLAFSQNGDMLAAGRMDGEIDVWNVKSQQPVAVLLGHAGAVHALDIKDGNLASGGADYIVRTWTINPAKFTHKLSGHEDFVKAVAFNSDGSHLASGGADGSIRIWDSKTGQQIGSLTGHLGTIRCLRYGSDPHLLLSGSEDQTARLWDDTVDVQMMKLVLTGYKVSGAAFESAGRHVVIGGVALRGKKPMSSGVRAEPAKEAAFRVWDVGQRPEEGYTLYSQDPVTTVALSPNGHLLASAGAGATINLWDVTKGNSATVVRPLQSDGLNSILCLAFSRDGRLAAAGTDGAVRVWDSAFRGKPLSIPKLDGDVWSIAFHPTENTLAVAVGRDVHLFDLESKKRLATIHHGDGTVWTISFSRNGEWLATGGGDSTVRVWEVHENGTSKMLGEQRLTDEVWGVPFSPDGKLIATSGLDRTVRLFELPDLKKERPYFEGEHDGLVYSASFSPDSRWVATASVDHSVGLWNVASRRTLKLRLHDRPVWWVTFSSTGNVLASAGLDRRIQVRNIPALERILNESPEVLLKEAYAHTGLTVIESDSGQGRILTFFHNLKLLFSGDMRRHR